MSLDTLVLTYNEHGKPISDFELESLRKTMLTPPYVHHTTSNYNVVLMCRSMLAKGEIKELYLYIGPDEYKMTKETNNYSNNLSEGYMSGQSLEDSVLNQNSQWYDDIIGWDLNE